MNQPLKQAVDLKQSSEALNNTINIANENANNLRNWLYTLNISSVTAVIMLTKSSNCLPFPIRVIFPWSIWLFFASLITCVIISCLMRYSALHCAFKFIPYCSGEITDEEQKSLISVCKGWEIIIIIAFMIGYGFLFWGIGLLIHAVR